jgi:hypothetical protein
MLFKTLLKIEAEVNRIRKANKFLIDERIVSFLALLKDIFSLGNFFFSFILYELEKTLWRQFNQ